MMIIGHGETLKETKGIEFLKHTCLCGCTEFVTIFIDGHKCEICKRCIETENSLKNLKNIWIKNEI